MLYINDIYFVPDYWNFLSHWKQSRLKRSETIYKFTEKCSMSMILWHMHEGKETKIFFIRCGFFKRPTRSFIPSLLLIICQWWLVEKEKWSKPFVHNSVTASWLSGKLLLNLRIYWMFPAWSLVFFTCFDFSSCGYFSGKAHLTSRKATKISVLSSARKHNLQMTA